MEQIFAWYADPVGLWHGFESGGRLPVGGH